MLYKNGKTTSGIGLSIRNSDTERQESHVYECKTRKATPEELAYYTALVDKGKPSKQIPSLAGVERETPKNHSRGIAFVGGYGEDR